MSYDIIYIADFAVKHTGGSRFFVELASAMAKNFSVAVITGKIDEWSLQQLLRNNVDVFLITVLGDCEYPRKCPGATIIFLLKTISILSKIKFKLLHTNNHLPNLLAYIFPSKVIGSLHHLEEGSGLLKPVVKFVQFLELHAPYIILHTPSSVVPSRRRIIIPPIVKLNYVTTERRVEKGLLLMIGRLEERKQYDKAITALAVAKKFRPELKLYIVGDGPLRAYLQNLAKKLGVADSVIFTGIIDEKTKRELLGKAECFIHLGFPEGFGLAVFEAMINNIPVIADERIPVVRMFKGSIFPIKDLSDLAKLMIQCGMLGVYNYAKTSKRIIINFEKIYKKFYEILLMYQHSRNNI